MQQGDKLRADPAQILRTLIEPALGYDHVVIAIGNLILRQTEALPNQAAQSISPDSRAAFFGNGHAEPPRQTAFRPGNDKQHESG